MKRSIRVLVWPLFAATMYLILVELLWPWVRLPGLGNIGFTAVFVLFSLLHCTAIQGVGRTATLFASSAVVSFAMEEFGVRTGWIYGRYHYGDLLGAKLGHVPVLIPLAWFMMVYPSWVVALALLDGARLSKGRDLVAVGAVAALVMTAWDLVMDPGMAAAGNWVWERGGAYFGVPRWNYLGWLATTFLIYLVFGWVWRVRVTVRREPHLFEALPIAVYGLFALRYVVASEIPALQVVALFCMGTPALIAAVRMSTLQADTGAEATL